MAPKIKTTLEATPDSEDTEISPPAKVPKRKAKARPQVPPAARTPKRKSEKKTQKEQKAPGTPRGRPSKESVFITEVASKCVLHQDVVTSVLDAVQAVAVDTLKTKRKFAVGFFHGRLTVKPEAPPREKMVNGKMVSFAASPAKTIVKLSPSKHFRMMFD